MRKIKEEDFIDFTYSDTGFCVTLISLKEIINLFKSRAHGTITGRKKDGGTAIIDQK